MGNKSKQKRKVVSQLDTESNYMYRIFRSYLVHVNPVAMFGVKAEAFGKPDQSGKLLEPIDFIVADAIYALSQNKDIPQDKLQQWAETYRWRSRTETYVLTCFDIGSRVLHSPALGELTATIALTQNTLENVHALNQEITETIKSMMDEVRDRVDRQDYRGTGEEEGDGMYLSAITETVDYMSAANRRIIQNAKDLMAMIKELTWIKQAKAIMDGQRLYNRSTQSNN